MTEKNKRLEGVKQEIRSVLLTRPLGFSVKGLADEYRAIIGQHLPYREFGYSNPNEFLQSIPDVVSMMWSSRYNAYMLKAVADETTKHIEKLVSKQKVTKSLSLSSRRIASTASPPRFNRSYPNRTLVKPHLPLSIQREIFEVAKEFKNGLSLVNFVKAFRRKFGKDLIYENYGFFTIEGCLNAVKEVLLRTEDGEVRIFPIIETPKGTSLYSATWAPVQNGSSKCINSKENPPVNVVAPNNNTSSVTVSSNKPTERKTMDALDNFSFQDESFEDNYGTTPALREQFKQVMKDNPQGVWVTQFSSAFMDLRVAARGAENETEGGGTSESVITLKKTTGCTLDHEELGYLNLIDLFSDLPEIFQIEVIEGYKDDWKLFDATSIGRKMSPKAGSDYQYFSAPRAPKDISEVMGNIRLLLQASSDGIKLEDFCSLYQANCNESLNLSDLGFVSLVSFLVAVADSVPLTMDSRKTKVYYKKEIATSPHLEPTSIFPHNAVVGYTEYKLQKFPEDQKNYSRIQISSVVDPGFLYIQLLEDNVYNCLNKLMDELELFYYSKESESYKVPIHCIMTGMICAAVWPDDGHWHRVRISGVPSNDTVVAFFMDYGTKQRISNSTLRFLKKEFLELPAQAIRCHLDGICPLHGNVWLPEIKDYILSRYEGKPLMAGAARNLDEDESLPVYLCDTSGENDVYLNDLLVSKGFAAYTKYKNMVDQQPAVCNPVTSGESVWRKNNEEVQFSSLPVQAQGFPGNVPENISQIMSLCNASSNGGVQNPSTPMLMSLLNTLNNCDSSLHPLILKQLQVLGTNNNMTSKPITSSPPNAAGNNNGPHFNPSSVGFCDTNAPASDFNHGSDSEVFESDDEIDADDNPEVNSISKRYVKRVNLDDGYNHVHMIVIDERAYMSSGDITSLLWAHDDPNYVRRKLKSKEITIPTHNLKEVGYEQLFYQLGKFHVKGIKTEVNGNNFITLFPFKNVIDILNIFGHPSVAVRDIIDSELLHFDPTDSFWRTISEEEFEENRVSTGTSNDKEQKVCLHELKASLQALKFRKQTLKNQLYSCSSIPSLGDEIEKIETQCSEVESRIREQQMKIVSHQRERGCD